jgi:hypothetical protein
MTSVDAFERLAAMTVSQGEWTLTIDFGATFTEVTATSPENNRQIVKIDGEHQMPSVVSVDETGELRVGRAAEEIARSRPDRAERELKRRLGEKTAIVLGDRAYDPVVLVAAVLRHAADAAIDQLGSTPVKVRLTHPDTWSDARIAKLAEAGTNAGLVNIGTEAESIDAAATTAPTVMESANEPAGTRTVFEEVPQSGTTTMPQQPPNVYTPIPPTASVPDAPKSSVKKPVLVGVAIGAVLLAGLGFALTRDGGSTASPTTTTIALVVPETIPTRRNAVTLPPRKTPTTLFPSKDPNDTLPPRTPTSTTVPPRPTPPTSVKTPPTTVAPTPSTTSAAPRTTVPTTAPAPPPPTTPAPGTTAPAVANPQQAVDAMVLTSDDVAKAAATTGWRTGTYPESAPLCGLALPSPVAQQRSPVNVSVGDGAYVNVTTYAYAPTSKR